MSIDGAALFGASVLLGNIFLRRNRRKRGPEGEEKSHLGTLVLPGDGQAIPLSTNEGEGAKCELLVRNDSGENCVLIWVDFAGSISHGYRLINGGSIKDGSVSNEHLEYTYPFHSFIILKECAEGYPVSVGAVDPQMLVCSYRPEVGQKRHILHLQSQCGGISVGATSRPLRDRSDLIDTASKQYDTCTMSGFTVCFEPGVFEKHPPLLERLKSDLIMAYNLLPELAGSLLQNSTRIWLNDSLIYGYSSEPVVGRGCCYHPNNGREWLVSNGMSTDKCGCVEIYSAADYLKDNDLWGVGGVLVHELSHAYHNQYCADGYENSSVDEAYRVAMARGLYDSVRVHGSQGRNGPTKAYACANRMEFFAELSVAYMCEDDSCEYNKWFPFNKSQLIDHDPATFSILDKLWQEPFLSG